MIRVSVKELIEGIATIVEERIPEIITVKYTGIPNTEKAKEFPQLFIFLDNNVTIDENINTVPLTLWFVDVQISQSLEWRKDYEIKSDMIQAASKLFDILQNEGWLDSVNVTLTPLTSDMQDGLSGMQAIPTFNLQKPCYED